MRVSDFLIAKVGEGECIPKGYGLAWREFDRVESIFLPVPFNIIVSFARSVYWHMVMAFYPSKIDEIASKSRGDGFELGHKVGYEMGRKAGELEGYNKCKKEIDDWFDWFKNLPPAEQSKLLFPDKEKK